jgi:hypothetical protein
MYPTISAPECNRIGLQQLAPTDCSTNNSYMVQKVEGNGSIILTA